MENKPKKVLIGTIIIVIITMAVISVVGVYLNNNGTTVLQGQIESEVIKISGKLLGRIDKLYVEEGEDVKINDTVVYIKSLEADALMQTAQAMEDVAKYQNTKVDKGARKQIIEAAQQAYEAAKAQNNLAKTTYQRVENLYKEGVVTSQKRDEVAALAAQAAAAENAALAQYNMAKEGAEKEDKEAAKALVNAAKGNVNQVKAFLVDSKLTSPINGQVSTIYPSVGELVMPGSPIMSVVNLDSVYVVLNVTEEYLPQFKMHGTFKGTVPGIGNKEIEFRIYYISPLGSFATWRSTRQSGTYDMATFRIKASPVNAEDLNLGLRPGMSVLVKVDKSKRK